MKKSDNITEILRQYGIGIAVGIFTILCLSAGAALLVIQEYISIDSVMIITPVIQFVAGFLCALCTAKLGGEKAFVTAVIAAGVLTVIQLIIGMLLFSTFSQTILWNILGGILGGVVAGILCKRAKKHYYKRKNRMRFC